MRVFQTANHQTPASEKIGLFRPVPRQISGLGSEPIVDHWDVKPFKSIHFHCCVFYRFLFFELELNLSVSNDLAEKGSVLPQKIRVQTLGPSKTVYISDFDPPVHRVFSVSLK